MVIVHLIGGLGNQIYQYAMGRLLSIKLNTELKLDITGCQPNFYSHAYYRLGDFNIQEVFATPAEIKHVRETGKIPDTAKDIENIQGDVFVRGYGFNNPDLYNDIADILRKDFTLKKPFNPNAETWRQKILFAECSVSMHFRHGDFAYNPGRKVMPNFPILPLDYYYTCIDILKQRYDNLTVFVFSDNLPWVKENLRLDVPTEFVEDCETDNEEFLLISHCKHNIMAVSTFSRLAAWLNPNPDKKFFIPIKSNAAGVRQFLNSLTPDKKKTLANQKGRTGVPYDFDNQQEITLPPIFSLLLLVNNDAANLPATLDSLLNQDYKYYEVIIIDNASTDGSDKICQDAVAGKKNVTYKRLEEKISNAKAWNEAFKAAQGKCVLFLKVGDRFLANSLSTLYCINEYAQKELIHMFSWLKNDDNGNVAFADKKFSAQCDDRFKQAKNNVINSGNGFDAARLLLNREINSFLGTKVYNHEFLTEHAIKFDESIPDDDAEIFFQAEAFFKSKYFMYLKEAFYVAPYNNAISGGGDFRTELEFVSLQLFRLTPFIPKEISLKNLYKTSEEIPSIKILKRCAA